MTLARDPWESFPLPHSGGALRRTRYLSISNLTLLAREAWVRHLGKIVLHKVPCSYKYFSTLLIGNRNKLSMSNPFSGDSNWIDYVLANFKEFTKTFPLS